MSTSIPRQMSPHELGMYLLSKGLLHDCSLSVHAHGDRLDLNIRDVNVAFKGLPEYEGRTGCVIALEGVAQRDPIAEGDAFKVFEAAIEQDAEGNLTEHLLVTFWPAGHLRVAFSRATVHEEAMARADLR